MSIKTKSQKMAGYVLEKIEGLQKSNYTEKVSSYIVTNGLLPTLAFLKSKKEKDVYECIEEWLKRNIMDNNSSNTDIISYLANNDAAMLRLATIEALELSNWMKRLVKKEEKEDK